MDDELVVVVVAEGAPLQAIKERYDNTETPQNLIISSGETEVETI